MTGKRYDEVDKLKVLAVLAANKGNISLTAQETGVSIPTISRWAREKPMSLDERLEDFARYLLMVMPEKANEANLEQLTRALKLVLDNMQRDRSAQDRRGEIYEKLARLMDRYAAQKREDSDPEQPDGE